MEHIDALGKQCPIPVMMAKKLIDQDLDAFTVAVDNKTATQNLKNLAKLSFYDTSIDGLDAGNFLVSFTKCGQRTVSTLQLNTTDVPAAGLTATVPEQSPDTVWPTPAELAAAAAAAPEVPAAATPSVPVASTQVEPTAQIPQTMRTAQPPQANLAVDSPQAAPSATANPSADARALGDYVVFVRQYGIGNGSVELGHNLMKMALYTLAEGDLPPKAMLFMNEGVRLPAGGDNEVYGHLQRLQQRGCELLVCGACLNYYGLTEQLRVGAVSNMYEILGRMQSAGKTITL